MTQQDLLELLSRSLDETLSTQDQDRLNQALESHPELVDLRDTLVKNREFTRGIPLSSPEAPILANLTYEKPGAIKNLWLAAGLAAAILFCAWIVFFRTPLKPEPSSMHELNQHLATTQAAYKSAIDALEKRAFKRLDELPPDLQLTFRDNLHLIDQAIIACEAAVQSQYTHVLAYQNVSKAYEAKVRLLEQILKT